jgi:cation diffusion facilitator family transporter
MSQASSLRAVLYALGANAGILVAKGTAAAITGSSAMLAEAIHSAADCGNQVLLLFGMKDAKRAADDRHPLGYGRAVYFWAFLVAVLLFTLGGLFSIYEGWHKLHESEPLNQPWVALAVLALAIVLETGSTIGCLREIKRLRKERSLREWLRTTRNAELVVVLGEDIAALIGLILAFGFVSLATVTGDVRYDAMGSITIGVVLICVSLFIAIRIKGLIVGRSAEEDLQAGIRAEIASQPGVEKLLNAITMQLGPQVMLAVKVKMTPGASIEAAVENINHLEKRIKARFPEVAWCFVEPDVVD